MPTAIDGALLKSGSFYNKTYDGRTCRVSVSARAVVVERARAPSRRFEVEHHCDRSHMRALQPQLTAHTHIICQPYSHQVAIFRVAAAAPGHKTTSQHTRTPYSSPRRPPSPTSRHAEPCPNLHPSHPTPALPFGHSLDPGMQPRPTPPGLSQHGLWTEGALPTPTPPRPAPISQTLSLPQPDHGVQPHPLTPHTQAESSVLSPPGLVCPPSCTVAGAGPGRWGSRSPGWPPAAGPTYGRRGRESRTA